MAQNQFVCCTYAYKQKECQPKLTGPMFGESSNACNMLSDMPERA
jgi:hypothetical protein